MRQEKGPPFSFQRLMTDHQKLTNLDHFRSNPVKILPFLKRIDFQSILPWQMLWSTWRNSKRKSWWKSLLCFWWGCCSWHYTVSSLENLIGEISLWSQYQAGWASPSNWFHFTYEHYESCLPILYCSVSTVRSSSAKQADFSDVLILLTHSPHSIMTFLHLLIV